MEKLTIVLFSAAMMFLFTQCSSPSAKAFLENNEKRGEIISALLSSHEYTSQLMDSMMNNKHSMMMMNENNMKMMMKDSIMSNNLMNSMMGNHKMMQSMMQMMHQGGMMSKDCMESSMKMMGTMDAKAMDMKQMDGMMDEKK